MMPPQTNVLPAHKDEAELKRLLELEEEFDRQQGCGGAEAHADDLAGWAPQTNVLPDHKDEAELKRILEVEEEFRRQQGCGTAEAHADDLDYGDGADGDGE